MKQKQLELLLQNIPPPDHPKPEWEQYHTPATIAADILYTAYAYGDIAEKHVIDLGCGTGTFAIGAAILGAKQVTAIDIDKDSIKIAKQHAQQHQLSIDFHTHPIEKFDIIGDTVLMNPPFGAQKSNLQADRRFLEKAMDNAEVVYSLHLEKTLPFLQKMITAKQGNITHNKTYEFPIPHQFHFHQKIKTQVKVVLLRITS